MKLTTIQELSVGQRAEFSKTISESDVYQFAGITGDINPLHIDEIYAQNTFFKQRVVHGAFLAGMISAVLGTKLPGPGAIYASQTLNFKKPVFIGDTITAFAEVKELNAEENRVIFHTGCVNQQNELTAEGTSVILPSKKQSINRT